MATFVKSLARLHYGERPDEGDKLSGLEQKRRALRTADCGLRAGEGLVDEDSPGSKGLDESGEERSVQIVHDNDHIKQSTSKRDVGRFEVQLSRDYRKTAFGDRAPKVLERCRVSIDGRDGQTEGREPECMPAAAAGNVEGVAVTRKEVRVTGQPGRRNNRIRHRYRGAAAGRSDDVLSSSISLRALASASGCSTSTCRSSVSRSRFITSRFTRPSSES